MGKPESGVSPAQQIRRAGIKEPFRRVKEPGVTKGKVFLFENHSHAIYDPSSGLIEIIKSTKPEKEVGGTVESDLTPAGKMTLPIAIAQTLHIADQFALEGGEVTEKDREVLAKTLEMLDWLEKTPIDENERQEKERQVGTLLEEVGYRNARDRHRVKIAEKLWAGSNLDSLGRRNPEAKKTQVEVAYRSGRRRDHKNRAIFEKYGLRLLRDLVREREIERERIKQAIIAIEAVQKTPHSQWWKSYERKAQSLIQRLPTIISLYHIRVAPFAYPVAEAFAGLVYSPDSSEEKRLIQILGEEKLRELRRDSSLEKLLKSVQYAPAFVKEAVDNKLGRAHAKLVQILEEEEQTMQEERTKRDARLAEQGIGV